jgi:hypothetical protein
LYGVIGVVDGPQHSVAMRVQLVPQRSDQAPEGIVVTCLRRRQ